MVYPTIPKTQIRLTLYFLYNLDFSIYFFLQDNNKFRGPISLNCQPLPAYCQSMNMSQQMMYAKRLTNEKMKNFPKPIIFQNHVHYIGNKTYKIINMHLLKFTCFKISPNLFHQTYWSSQYISIQ